MGSEHPPNTEITPRCCPLLLSLRFPVVQELLQPGFCQRVFEERLKHTVGHRADVTACQCRLDNVLRMADARY